MAEQSRVLRGSSFWGVPVSARTSVILTNREELLFFLSWEGNPTLLVSNCVVHRKVFDL